MVAPPRPRRMNQLLWDMLCLVCKLNRNFLIFCKEYKRQTLAVLFVLLEAISVMLETFGKNTVGSVLASFILSVFGAGVTLYTTFVTKERIRNIELVVVEIVFSFVQLIVTYIDLIMKFLRIKSNYEVSLFPLAFAIIVLVFAFKKNPVDERPAASFLRALEREPHSIRSDSSLLTLHLQQLVEDPFVSTAMWLPLSLHRRFLRYVKQKITEVCDFVYKYKIHILAVVSLVLDAISSVAPDQLSSQSKQSFVLATSLLLPVFGFACIKGRTKRQHIGVVEVVFAMFQLIIITLVHFTLTISGATNNYNAPWFPLAFAAIVVFVFNKDKNDPFKVIRQRRSRIVQRYIDLALLNSYEDLYKKVKQVYKIKGQLHGSEREWELTYITTWHEWRVVGSDELVPLDWQQFRHEAEVMIIHRRQRQDYVDYIDDVKDDSDDRFDGDDVKDDSDDSFDGDNDDDDSGGVNDDDDSVKEAFDDSFDGDNDNDNDDDDGGGGVNDDDDDGVEDDDGWWWWWWWC